MGANWPTPEYDANGNSTFFPDPRLLTDGLTAAYDAWNRLVLLEEDNGLGGLQTLAELQYDGLNRRTVKIDYRESMETRHYYYSDQWQVLEERVDDDDDANRQFVWGLRYVDDLVLRDRSVSGSLDERLYALQDANWNVVALCDTAGAVEQRVAYTPYGVPEFLAEDFYADSDHHDWETLFTGQRFDAASGLYLYRMRYYHPELGRFLQRDPIGYDAGDWNLYEYVRGNPINHVDAKGFQRGRSGPIPRPRPPQPSPPQPAPPSLPPTPDWQKKCDPTGPCPPEFQPPPTNDPPEKGDPCYYPNRKVCVTLSVWGVTVTENCYESQCVCQCVGGSPALNCMRGCIRCSHENGAPIDLQAEQYCQAKCNPTLKDLERLNCCVNNEPSMGGCRGTRLAAPKDPPPNSQCKNIK